MLAPRDISDSSKILTLFSMSHSNKNIQTRKEYESMIQFQSDPFNMIEARLSRLENMCRNKEILPTQSLTIPNTFNHIDENQKS